MIELHMTNRFALIPKKTSFADSSTTIKQHIHFINELHRDKVAMLSEEINDIKNKLIAHPLKRKAILKAKRLLFTSLKND